MTRSRNPRLVIVALAAALVGVSACSAAPSLSVPAAAPIPSPSLGDPSTKLDRCDDGLLPTASFQPSIRQIRGDEPLGGRTLQKRIRDRGRLVVGVSADSYLLGALKPGTLKEFEGFDIDIAREVAKSLLGDAGKIQFKVITAADRIDAVNAGVEKDDGTPGGGVDLVARNMTMTCPRWKDVNFSAVYFLSAQQVLVPEADAEAGVQSIKDVARRPGKNRICAPRGSTSLNNIPVLAPGAQPVEASQHTACLAMLQQGQVDAITGDNTVLAGLAAQDRSTKVVGGTLTAEPYGLAVAKDHPEFAQYLNGVLERIIKNGTWQKLYDEYFKERLGSASPPTLEYGKKPSPS